MQNGIRLRVEALRSWCKFGSRLYRTLDEPQAAVQTISGQAILKPAKLVTRRVRFEVAHLEFNPKGFETTGNFCGSIWCKTLLTVLCDTTGRFPPSSLIVMSDTTGTSHRVVFRGSVWANCQTEVNASRRQEEDYAQPPCSLRARSGEFVVVCECAGPAGSWNHSAAEDLRTSTV